MRASGQPPEPPVDLPPAPRASGAAVLAPLVAAGSPPTPTGAAEPSSSPPPGEAVAFPSGTAPAPSPGAAEADGTACAPGAADVVTVALADGPPLGAEGAADGALEGAGCASVAADGVAAGLASVGTST